MRALLITSAMIAGGFFAASAHADPSPTCGCSAPFHPFGSGPDASGYDTIFVPNHTYCMADPSAFNEDDTAGTFRPCGPKTGGAGGATTAPLPVTARLSVTLKLASEQDCETKITYFLGTAQTVIPSGSTGAITQAAPYCRQLFPLGGGSAQLVTLALTYSFATQADCNTKLDGAVGEGATVERAVGSALEPIISAENYCASIFSPDPPKDPNLVTRTSSGPVTADPVTTSPDPGRPPAPAPAPGPGPLRIPHVSPL